MNGLNTWSEVSPIDEIQPLDAKEVALMYNAFLGKALCSRVGRWVLGSGRRLG
ncbi:hypothetical protein BH23ACT12_BH23ACT12_11340 [soil metagenome]